jgi:hypothetical protein
MTKNKSMCRGCHNDFYNHRAEGGCWNFDSATVVVRMRVGVWQTPPYHWTPEECLSCYTPDGERMIGRSDSRVVD